GRAGLTVGTTDTGGRRAHAGLLSSVDLLRPGRALGHRKLCVTAVSRPTRPWYRSTMSKWTAADIPDLSNKLAVVTGANSGLGLETTRALARKGARVVMACRTQAKAEAAVDELVGDGIERDLLEFRALDLSSLASIQS